MLDRCTPIFSAKSEGDRLKYLMMERIRSVIIIKIQVTKVTKFKGKVKFTIIIVYTIVNLKYYII